MQRINQSVLTWARLWFTRKVERRIHRSQKVSRCSQSHLESLQWFSFQQLFHSQATLHQLRFILSDTNQALFYHYTQSNTTSTNVRQFFSLSTTTTPHTILGVYHRALQKAWTSRNIPHYLQLQIFTTPQHSSLSTTTNSPVILIYKIWRPINATSIALRTLELQPRDTIVI